LISKILIGFIAQIKVIKVKNPQKMGYKISRISLLQKIRRNFNSYYSVWD